MVAGGFCRGVTFLVQTKFSFAPGSARAMDRIMISLVVLARALLL